MDQAGPDFVFYLWIAMAAVLAPLLVYCVWQRAQRRRAGEVPLPELLLLLQPVHLESVALATSALKKHRSVDRQILAAGRGVLRQMTRNAAALQAAGYPHLRSVNPLIQSFAEEMIDAGVRVRLYSLYLLAVLNLWRLLSSARIPCHILTRISGVEELVSSSLHPAYELLRTSAGNLGAFKYPGEWQQITSRL